MSAEKPKDLSEYLKWLQKKFGIEISTRDEAYYKTVTTRIAADLQASEFWIRLNNNLIEYHDEYILRTGYHLLVAQEFHPTIIIKPFDSFLLKTYRKNILTNRNWPEEPQGNWILPSNWYSKINDTVRTLIEVKYLDGVEFIIAKIKALCKEYSTECRVFLEAREEGYYAAHLYIKREFEIPKVNWDTEKIVASIEIQITTQLQEVIRKLLHSYYEEKRKNTKNAEATKWQWNYKSEEFASAYLGHILHYVEGMIMEIREKQKHKERLR